MKKPFTLLTLAFSVLLAQAQTTSDPDAKRILDAVSANFRTFKSPQASFTYTVENAQGKALSTKKGVVGMRGNKYHVTMSGMEIFSDGRTSWNYDKSANEVTINNANSSGSAMTPQKLITNFYDKEFLYKLNEEKKIGNKTVHEIEMTATDKRRPFHKVYVWVDKAAKTIHSAKFLEKSGNRYTYTVNSIKPNAALPDTYFVFDRKKYPGVEVVDLR